MRWLIAGLLLALGWLGITSTDASGDRARALSPPWPERVEGFGMDAESACHDALRQAQRQIAVFLQRQDPPILGWSPSEEFIRRQLVTAGSQGPDLPLEPGSAKSWVLKLRPPDLTTYYRLEENRQRQIRDEQRGRRVSGFGKILAGMVLLLGMGAGYSRLRERSRPACRPKAIA